MLNELTHFLFTATYPDTDRQSNHPLPPENHHISILELVTDFLRKISNQTMQFHPSDGLEIGFRTTFSSNEHWCDTSGLSKFLFIQRSAIIFLTGKKGLVGLRQYMICFCYFAILIFHIITV